MPLAAGSRLGAYQIVSAIGSGGMGEVYRARDTKLQRDVALKVLPDHLAADPERLARFQREAQVLASLNHPNIAGTCGLEDADGIRALVLELPRASRMCRANRVGDYRVDANTSFPPGLVVADPKSEDTRQKEGGA